MSHWTETVDFKKISKEYNYGFEGFIDIAELAQSKCKDIPERNGVYFILYPRSQSPCFIANKQALQLNGLQPKSAEILWSQWIDSSPVLYIGKAGKINGTTNLKKRLKEYLKWYNWHKNKHHGGRDIWQIKDAHKLLIAWRVCEDEEPEACEKKLLARFKSEFNQYLPFANHRL